ncbi:protein O-linked-mannose beta-1,2-N-acetylglucosaminyltransferase 1-like [Amphibalanus amphitrite]|uniref:protein O-linked-mannose beta-1,2-N-acetylglucosaminyltransferase 1-like n=1 Tax=Amphibalanus amphitrite TaxID=1232801 RepID=UPI001C917F28|nr:protein O-linked-mannose beta-1,2-N-acetylglucosaminyltransferase 1-like [Amphibalanus amphitrite]
MPGAVSRQCWAGCVLLLSLVALSNGAPPAAPTTSEDAALLAELEGTAADPDLFIEVLSSPSSCHVRVDGRTVLYRQKRDPPSAQTDTAMWDHTLNGMYVVSLHPSTGAKTGEAYARGDEPNAAFAAMEEFVRSVQPGRLLVLCVLAEASLSLDRPAVALLRALNSSYAPDLQYRSLFGMALVRGGPVLAEGYVLNLDAVLFSPPGDLRMTARAPRPPAAAGCLRGQRARFCELHDGYRGLCDCGSPAWLRLQPRPLPGGGLFPYPIVIVASNRPKYLFRCLASLLANRGLDRQRVVVFVDGDYEEVRQLLDLLDVPLHQHQVELPTSNAGSRIGAIYRYTVQRALQMFPEADKLVLLEEDLEVAPDFVSFFDQTHHLLDVDPSLYCISAWNDHGYEHTVGDPSQLYRVGFLPGLGWMLKRSFFLEEVLPRWPPAWSEYDWDVLLRLDQFRRGRDCVIPDVSRTYHFGFIGQHVNSGMQFKMYYDHALNRDPDVRLRNVDDMIYHRYEAQLMEEIKHARMIDGRTYNNESSCDGVLPPEPTNHTYVIFIVMENAQDVQAWQKVSTCLNLWDLDVRGDHRGLWRFWYRGNPIMVIGSPYAELSAFAVHEHGEATIWGGRRSARQARLGRWPPGLHRSRSSDRTDRLRLSSAAVRRAQMDVH